MGTARDSVVLQEDIVERLSVDLDIDMDEYVPITDVNERIEAEVEHRIEENEMKQALMIDTIESKHKQKYALMEQSMKNEIDRLTQMNHEMTAKLEQVAENEHSIKVQLERVEADKISLLTRFMKEMDRMRDEIRKLNQLKA